MSAIEPVSEQELENNIIKCLEESLRDFHHYYTFNPDGVKKFFHCAYNQTCTSIASDKTFNYDFLSGRFLHEYVCSDCRNFTESQ